MSPILTSIILLALVLTALRGCYIAYKNLTKYTIRRRD